ncbi:MAG: hypothetical protein GY862_01440 [Gammaproteobacteria bacterium]|nr:hypothetical protein [Gammaproteobacteria bacterium]
MDETLRALAKAYYQDEYDWETFHKKRTELIDRITSEEPAGEPLSSLDIPPANSGETQKNSRAGKHFILAGFFLIAIFAILFAWNFLHAKSF